MEASRSWPRAGVGAVNSLARASRRLGPPTQSPRGRRQSSCGLQLTKSLRQMIFDVSDLMDLAALDHGRSNTSKTARRSALDRRCHQHRAADIEAARKTTSRTVTKTRYAVRLHQRQRCLTVDTDPNATTQQVSAKCTAVDHQRHQVQRGQIGGEQLGQGGLGDRHELRRDRRLAVAEAISATCWPTDSSPTG